MQELGGRRDRVAGEEERQAAADAGGDQPERGRPRAVDAAVGAGLGGRGLDLVADLEELGRLAEVVAGAEGRQVRLPDRPASTRTSPRSSALVGSVGGCTSTRPGRARRGSSSVPRRGSVIPSMPSVARTVIDVIGTRNSW